MTPTYDELVEVVARGMGRSLAKNIESDIYACEMTLNERIAVASDLIEALRGAMVPVMYIATAPDQHVEITDLPLSKTDFKHGWTEQALYALPTPEDK